MSLQPRAKPPTVTRCGMRRKKLEGVQPWHNKTYPLRMILLALTDDDTGYSLEETAARLRKRGHRQFSPSIITSWLDEYRQYGSYRRSRAEGLKRFPASQTIWSIKLYHRHEGLQYHLTYRSTVHLPGPLIARTRNPPAMARSFSKWSSWLPSANCQWKRKAVSRQNTANAAAKSPRS
jgi:hypothetical protein